MTHAEEHGDGRGGRRDVLRSHCCQNSRNCPESILKHDAAEGDAGTARSHFKRGAAGGDARKRWSWRRKEVLVLTTEGAGRCCRRRRRPQC